MRKCEKDFRQVFSFLLCLLDALPLYKFTWGVVGINIQTGFLVTGHWWNQDSKKGRLTKCYTPTKLKSFKQRVG